MSKINDLLKNCYRKEDIDTKIIFYQTPKFLIHSDKYKDLGLAEKLVYSVLRDRLELSINNKKEDFVDENGYVFIRFDQEKLGELLNINKKTVGRYMKNLEEHNLIVIIREGRGRSNRIYITDISKQLETVYTYEDDKEDKEDKDNEKEDITLDEESIIEEIVEVQPEDIENTLKGQNVTSRSDKMPSLEVTKSPHNDTNIINTDFSETIFLSPKCNDKINLDVDNSIHEREKDSNKKLNEFNLILENCNYKDFEDKYVNAILQAIRLLYYSNRSLRINDMSVPPSQVREDLKLLRWNHLDLALRDFKIQAKNQEIKYPIGYLSRCIYNAIFQGELRIESDLLYHDLL